MMVGRRHSLAAMKTAQLQIRLTPRQKAALESAARRAGQPVSAYVLSRVLPEAGARFAELLDRLRAAEDRHHAFAELIDLLVEIPAAELGVALAEAVLDGLSPLVQNQVAAMVEQAADQKGVRPPRWVSDVEPLTEPHFATDLRSLRLYLLLASPVPFRKRNLFVDSGVGDRV